MKKSTTEDFISKAFETHGNEYDYSKSIYVRAKTEVIIICKQHGEFNQLPITHLKGTGCPKCAVNKRKTTNLEKYGVEYPMQSTQFKEQAKQTNLEKYGVEHHMQNDRSKHKIKQTNLEKYGVEWNISSEQSKTKRINTCLDRYGFNNPRQSNNVITKIIETKYDKDINYGLTYIQDIDWLIYQYIDLNKSSPTIANELGISCKTVINYLHRYEISIRQSYNQSFKAIEWLNQIMEQEGIQIQHAFNGGEYQIPGTKYKADGYCAETNTIYEFYGDYWHGNPKVYLPDTMNDTVHSSMGDLYQKTLKREQEIRVLGFDMISIWESDFN